LEKLLIGQPRIAIESKFLLLMVCTETLTSDGQPVGRLLDKKIHIPFKGFKSLTVNLENRTAQLVLRRELNFRRFVAQLQNQKLGGLIAISLIDLVESQAKFDLT
jgi:hypothetical protein